ncbi:hypothetical protein P9112_002420 [Eukaryota sp. TZLM1-RC]
MLWILVLSSTFAVLLLAFINDRDYVLSNLPVCFVSIVLITFMLSGSLHRVSLCSTLVSSLFLASLCCLCQDRPESFNFTSFHLSSQSLTNQPQVLITLLSSWLLSGLSFMDFVAPSVANTPIPNMTGALLGFCLGLAANKLKKKSQD